MSTTSFGTLVYGWWQKCQNLRTIYVFHRKNWISIFWNSYYSVLLFGAHFCTVFDTHCAVVMCVYEVWAETKEPHRFHRCFPHRKRDPRGQQNGIRVNKDESEKERHFLGCDLGGVKSTWFGPGSWALVLESEAWSATALHNAVLS